MKLIYYTRRIFSLRQWDKENSILRINLKYDIFRLIFLYIEYIFLNIIINHKLLLSIIIYIFLVNEEVN